MLQRSTQRKLTESEMSTVDIGTNGLPLQDTSESIAFYLYHNSKMWFGYDFFFFFCIVDIMTFRKFFIIVVHFS